MPPALPWKDTRVVATTGFWMWEARASRRRGAGMIALAVATFLGASRFEAHAQLPRLDGGESPPSSSTSTSSTVPSSTTTPPAAPTSSTTTTAQPGLFGPPSSRPEPTTTSTTPPAAGDAEPLPAGEGDGGPATGAGPIPPELQRMIDSVRRTPANNTKKLLAALAPLGRFGLDPTQQAMVGFGRFPVAGVASWSDDWWFPRFGPGWRLHQGIDIFAMFGTPVRAPVDGTVRIRNGGLGGIAIYVVQPDRTSWYLAHLAGVAADLTDGATVKTGELIGYVGNSGNARGGAPHVHLQIHPRGGGPIPPKPVIDRFVADAINLAPQLIDAYGNATAQGEQPAPVAVAPPEPELTTITPREALLWASAANPAGGTLRLIQADARAAARRIDWKRVAARSEARRQAELRAWLVVRPLVPEALARVVERR